MTNRLLCLLVETGAYACVAPLLEEWSNGSPGFDWRVVATPEVRAMIESRGVAGRIVGPAIGRTSGAETIDLDDEGWRPDVVIASCAGAPVEQALIREARRRGIPSVQFIDTWYGYRRRLTDGDDLLLPDRVLVIDERAKFEALDEGLPSALVSTAGHPGWEHIVRLPESGSRDVVFLGAPIRSMLGTSLGYTEEDAWRVISEVAEDRRDLVGQLFYAPHPRQQLQADIPGATMVRYRVDLMREIGVVVGMFSAPLVDAYLAGRRAITLQPNGGAPDMCPLSRHGRIPRTRTRADLVDALSAPAPDPTPLAEVLKGSADRFTREIHGALSR